MSTDNFHIKVFMVPCIITLAIILYAIVVQKGIFHPDHHFQKPMVQYNSAPTHPQYTERLVLCFVWNQANVSSFCY